MPKGINISVAANTREFQQGVQKGMVAPLEDLQDTFADVARDGDSAGDKLESSLKEQQRATEEFGREYKEMSAQIQAASQRTSRSVSSDADEFSTRTKRGMDEIKDSARSNAIEVGASFTGGFDQAAGGLQGFLAEFLAGFGPAGVVAGIAAAAGLGLITQQITEGGEAAEAQKEKVRELAAEYIDAGKTGRRSFDSIADSIKAMATSDGSDVIITLQEAFEKAKIAGADYQEIVLAIGSGSPTEIAKAQRAVDELSGAHTRAADTARAGARAAVVGNQQEVAAVDVLESKLRDAKKTAEEAGRAQELAAKAGLSDLQLKADLVGQVEEAYDDAATGADHFNEKTGEFEVADFIADVKKVRAELKKYRDDLSQSDLSAEAKKFLEDQGAESAAAMLRGYQKATPKQKAQLNEIWSTAGTESAGSYEDALGKNLNNIKPDPIKIPQSVAPLADTAALDAQLRQPKYLRVIVDGYLRNGKQVF